MTADTRQKLLVVDDERINRTVLAELLRNDYQVLLAKSGEQALERLAQDPGIDLVLLDVVMPEMDGYEVLGRLKRNEATKDIPVVFITALSGEGDEERGFAMGACDYIAKPFSPTIVRSRVANLARFVRQRKMLEVLAGRDGLTEIPNRRLFDETLEREWGRHQRTGNMLSLALIDIDFFKQYNDHYGHAAGDAALKAVATVLARGMRRSGDFVARYGGEEFVLILPETDAVGGREVAELLRGEIEALALPHAASAVAPVLTLSIGGVSVVGGGEVPGELVQLADGALYSAKRQGRNRVVWHGM